MNPNLEKALRVDPITCDAKYPNEFKPSFNDSLTGDDKIRETENRIIQDVIDSIKKEYSENFEANDPATNENWIRFKFTLINLVVSSSVIAAYNIKTFYTTIVMVVSTTLKPICMFISV